MRQKATEGKKMEYTTFIIEVSLFSYNGISRSVVALALCTTTSLAASVPVARSAIRGMKAKAIGTAIDHKRHKIITAPGVLSGWLVISILLLLLINMTAHK